MSIRRWVLLLILGVAVGLGLTAPRAAAQDLFRGTDRMLAALEVDRLTEIQRQHEDTLFAFPQVHGVGIGADPLTRELVFAVSVDPVGLAPQLPLEIKGVKVVAERRERAVALHGGSSCIPCHANQLPLPVAMGNSTGNPLLCFSCTLGFKACKDGVIYYVTNAHCSPNASGCEGGAPLGSDTLHRGRLDAPACAQTTVIGTVNVSATPICGQNNTVDATRIISANTKTAWSIRDIGTPSTSWTTVLPGDTVRKSGRTTGYTTGTVASVNYTTNVSGYCCGSPKFVDQIKVNAGVAPFIQGGDSGSSLLNMANPPKLVGLLFAGDGPGTYGIANKISNVLFRLNLTLDPNCQPPSCEDMCYQQWSFCNEEYCYWQYDQYMCQIGCDLQLEQCLESC
jgi:hypothetical protein